ncbi:MAG TPA: ATPase domain-containing protein [Methanomassiliicoccales archaeon]|nr:ATPase domain-containing protein [Methanomassiliicoccales archaeon]
MTKGKDRSVPRAEQGNAEQVSLTADQAEVERLSRWLDGEGQGSALLTWLGEGGDFASEDELAELKDRVGRYEMELAAVRALLAVDGAEGEGTAQRLQALIQERDALKEAVSKAVAPNGGNGLAESKEKELLERYHAEIKDKDEQWKRTEGELSARIATLEKELAKTKIELKLKDDELAVLRNGGGTVNADLLGRLESLQSKEREFLMLKQEADDLRVRLKEKEEELDRIREAITYKEDELIRREEDLMYREKVYTAERKRLEEMKRETGGLEEAELMKKLEALKAEVATKEDELRAKEKYVLARQEELRLREQGLIEDEITYREKERALELQERKVKTGIPRFDDLLLGGIPIGSNIMIHGPPFIGKEVMANTFLVEGLRKGIPALIVLTDRTPKDVRDEMKYIMAGFEEYEKLGLVRYVDTYSRAMGDDASDPYTVYIEQPNDHERLGETIDKLAKEFKEKHEYYRLVFRSVSTLIAYSDPNSAFRFLSPQCGRRKKDQAVSMYIVEKGMHSEQELQMLGSIMDGMVDFKVDQLKTFFAIRGISDVQSRAYIWYTATKSALTIGSFALDHIR